MNAFKKKSINNLVAKHTPREKFKSQVTYKRRFASVQNKMAPAILRDWTSPLSTMLANLIAGSLGELNYGEMFQSVFKMIMYNVECLGY